MLVASLLPVVRPGAPSSILAPSSNALVTSSFLLLLVRHLLLVAMPFAPSSVLAPRRNNLFPTRSFCSKSGIVSMKVRTSLWSVQNVFSRPDHEKNNKKSVSFFLTCY